MKLPVPVKVLDQHIIAFGKTGAGKSSKLRVLVEYLLHKKQPVNIIDPKGDWWGLKSSADGKGPGFPVVIFGGAHADVPITPASGTEVAKTIFAGNFASLIDMKGWMPKERAQFFIDYVAQIFRSSEGSRPMLIDECHNFAFKAKVLSPQAGEMLHWANRLASEGRGLGIQLMAASQRPQKVHNDFSTSCETLIAARVIHKADRDAIKDWIDGCADPEMGKQVIAQLAQLKKPEAFVWSPEIEFGPEKITFPMFTTYDSFAPQVKAAKKLKGWAEIDLDDVRTRLFKVIEQAKADDPATLKERIALLQLAAKQTAKYQAAPAAYPDLRKDLATAQELAGRQADANLLLLDHIETKDGLILEGMVHLGKAQVLLDDARKSFEGARKLPMPKQKKFVALHASPRKAVPDLNPGMMGHGGSDFPPPRPDRPKPVRTDTSDIRRDTNANVSAPQQKILDQLAWLKSKGIHPARKETLAAVCRVQPTSGGYAGNLSALNKAGLISYPQPGCVAATDAGERAAAEPKDLGKPVHEAWLDILSGPQRAIVAELHTAYPEAVHKKDLAVSIGVQPTSGGYAGNLAKLSKLGAIEYPTPGYVGLTRFVMPEG